MKLRLILPLLLALGVNAGFGQGFVNFNFENPILPLGPSGSFVPAVNAIPGWTAYTGSSPQSNIGYNGVSAGGAIVSLNDTNANGGGLNPLPIQGKYSIFVLGAPVSIPNSAGIGQTGTIPVGTQSISFWGGFASYGSFVVTFNGQPVNYFISSSTANYNIYAADISAYAGQTGELLFTAPARTALLLDNIQFSSTAVPEPGTLALVGLGLAFFAARRRNG